jgi:hypothetical protein
MAQLLLNTLIANNAPISGFYSETFTANSSSNSFTLSYYVTQANALVSVGGLLLVPSNDYTVNTASQTLTLKSTYSEDMLVEVRYIRAPEMMGQALYTTAGTYSWTAPTGVTKVSVVAVGGGGAGQISRGFSSGTMQSAGGGGGGGLGWIKDFPVTPGASYTVVVGAGGIAGTSGTQNTARVNGGPGGASYFANTSTVVGYGGSGGQTSAATGGSYVGDGGGSGGSGYYETSWDAGGGGGAGGYFGNGGAGGRNSGSNGSGGGGGGGSSAEYYFYGSSESVGGYGGGVGVFGLGSSGAGGTTTIVDYGASGIDYTAGNGGDGSDGSYGWGAPGSTVAYFSATRSGINGKSGAVIIKWGAESDPTIKR